MGEVSISVFSRAIHIAILVLHNVHVRVVHLDLDKGLNDGSIYHHSRALVDEVPKGQGQHKLVDNGVRENLFHVQLVCHPSELLTQDLLSLLTPGMQDC